MSQLLKGVIIGFWLAGPIGPIGLLCIRRSLTDGRLVGFISGLGAATADALFGLVATLGLTAVTHAVMAHQEMFHLVAAVLLLYLGVTTFRAQPPAQTLRPEHASSRWMAYASTLMLTLMNPMTIVSFMGIFVALGIRVGGGGLLGGGLLVLGVFLGSATWFLFLSTGAAWVGQRLRHGGLRIVNIVSGLLIGGFGVWQVVEFLRGYSG
jgi:threonine/homoserine/homoserine lactone efflux protein